MSFTTCVSCYLFLVYSEDITLQSICTWIQDINGYRPTLFNLLCTNKTKLLKPDLNALSVLICVIVSIFQYEYYLHLSRISKIHSLLQHKSHEPIIKTLLAATYPQYATQENEKYYISRACFFWLYLYVFIPLTSTSNQRNIQ